MKTWILVANSAEAKLLVTDNLRIGELELIRDFIHPESRKKISDLVSDRPGHYKTDASARSAFEKNDPKAIEVERFALQLTHELKAGLNKNQFKKILIVAPAHFYGLLKKHLHIPESLEEAHISRDYTKYTLQELHESLKKHLFG